MSQIGETGDVGSEPVPPAWNLAETVAFVFPVILLILLAGSLISALTTQSLFASVAVSVPDRIPTVALALQRAGAWAAPQSAALFVFGSLGLAWWQIETWTNDDGDPFDATAFVHLRRISTVTRIDLVLSVLIIAGGVLVVIGTLLEGSPERYWSTLAENLGIALGSVVLGVAGVVVARRLQASRLAAVATWSAVPSVA